MKLSFLLLLVCSTVAHGLVCSSPCALRPGARFVARRPLSIDMQSAFTPARAAKLAAFAGLTAASVRLAGPPGSVLARVFGGSLAATLTGVIDGHAAVSYGYGASLMWLAAVFSVQLMAQGPAARLFALTYALYGVKVCLFQAARDVRPAYVLKALAPARARAGSSGSAKRVPFCISIALLLSTFAFPLHVVAIATPSLAISRAVNSGAALALAGLLLQTVADVQKYLHKARRGANSPCTRGLWRFSRHPNYLGEIVFHCGLLLAALPACRSAAAVWLVLLAPVTFISIMLGSTSGLEAVRAPTRPPRTA